MLFHSCCFFHPAKGTNYIPSVISLTHGGGDRGNNILYVLYSTLNFYTVRFIAPNALHWSKLFFQINDGWLSFLVLSFQKLLFFQIASPCHRWKCSYHILISTINMFDSLHLNVSSRYYYRSFRMKRIVS